MITYPAETPTRGKKELLKKVGAWGAALLILGYLFWRIDFNAFWASMKMANLKLYLPLIVIFIFLWFGIEAQNIMVVLKHLGHTLKFRESLDVRGVTYLLMIINPFLGLGGIAFYLKKVIGIPLARASSVMIFYSYIEMMSLLYFVAAGSFFLEDPTLFFKQMHYWSLVSILIYSALIFFPRRYPQKGLFRKVSGYPVFKTFFEAKATSFLILPFWRGTYFIAFIVFFYFGLQTFSIHVPLFRLFVYVPLIFWIGCWPITPFGLGTIQASMIFFFKDYSTEANILAFSISYSTLLLLFRVPIGLYYLRKFNTQNGIAHSDLPCEK